MKNILQRLPDQNHWKRVVLFTKGLREMREVLTNQVEMDPELRSNPNLILAVHGVPMEAMMVIFVITGKWFASKIPYTYGWLKFVLISARGFCDEGPFLAGRSTVSFPCIFSLPGTQHSVT